MQPLDSDLLARRLFLCASSGLRAACIGPDDLTVGEKVGLLCVPHSRRGEIAVDVGVMMCSWSPYVLRSAEGLAAHVAAGAVPKAYCRFLS